MAAASWKIRAQENASSTMNNKAELTDQFIIAAHYFVQNLLQPRWQIQHA
jgi:hypothetical protein